MIECDAVFEGGGVKGIALVGGAAALEGNGYVFRNLAGSSAGAIVASLLAAGYNCDELERILKNTDFKIFRQKDFLDYLGLPGKLLSLTLSYGVYNTALIEDWLNGLLKAKGVYSFGDLDCDGGGKYKYGVNKCRLQVTASDLSLGRLLVLPDGLGKLGIEPGSFSIAAAVRMSISIPIFYEPYILKDAKKRKHYMADGGMLSNYPMWILDRGREKPARPVFGLRFIDDEINPVSVKCDESADCPRLNIIEYIKAVITTMTDARDSNYTRLAKGDEARTIQISTKTECKGKKEIIRTTDFDLSRAQSDALYLNGKSAGEAFLAKWDFEKWKALYRK